MGRNKAHLQLNGISLLRRIRETAKRSGLSTRLIRRDIIPSCGPLSGIYTGLATSKAEAEIFLACDMPFVTASLLRRLITDSKRSARPTFVRLDGKPGFPCVIPTRDAPAVLDQIAKNRFSLRQLSTRVKAAYLDLDSADPTQLLNINTPGELQSARRQLRIREGDEFG